MSFFPQQNVLEIFQQNTSRYLPLTQFIQNVMRGESAFTPGERELIAAYVSGLNSCDYCYNSHSAIAIELNVDPQLLKAILTDLATAPIEEPLRPVFTLIRKLTLTPSKITQEDIDQVLAAGWDQQAVSDAIAICSLFNFMNRLVDGFGLEKPSQAQLSGMVEMINHKGYQAII